MTDPRPTYSATWGVVRDEQNGATVARFTSDGQLEVSGHIRAQDYADWLNAGGPEATAPLAVKSTVWYYGRPAAITAIYWDRAVNRVKYDIYLGGTEDKRVSGLSESALQLTPPPQPRAKVLPTGTNFYAIRADDRELFTRSKELADHIAAGLNEHEDWTL